MTLDPSTDVSQMEKLLLQKISCYYLSNLIRPKYSNLHVIQKAGNQRMWKMERLWRLTNPNELAYTLPFA